MPSTKLEFFARRERDMRDMRDMRVGMLLLAGAIAGCVANPGIVEMSPGTYMLSREDKGGIFGNPSAMHTAVIQEANKFARNLLKR